LAKPVDRLQYIIGKFLGVAVIIGIYILIITVELFIILLTIDKSVILITVGALILVYFKLLIITAIVLFFSIFLSIPLNVIFTILIYYIGEMSMNYIYTILQQTYSSAISLIVRFAKYILPNFEYSNISYAILSRFPVPVTYFIEVILYSLFYIGFILILTDLIFREKEL
jgi:ABC-type transport system involved in multi-copper enzyme maturation permease subunit